MKLWPLTLQIPSGITVPLAALKQVPVGTHFLSRTGTPSPPMYHLLSPLLALLFCFAFACGFV